MGGDLAEGGFLLGGKGVAEAAFDFEAAVEVEEGIGGPAAAWGKGAGHLVVDLVGHVYGQGTNELWGAHATYPEAKPLPYVYSAWPYAVNVSTSARLNIAKLVPASGTVACPTAATGSSQSPFTELNVDWQGSSWYYLDRGTATVEVAYQRDMPYGAELNIKGSYVYGYNWDVRNESITDKSGWWRLTFYTPDNSISFADWVNPTSAGDNALAPPPTTSVPAVLSSAAITPSEGESGLLLYVPIIDKEHNLTYLDICIKSGNAGGGGGSR